MKDIKFEEDEKPKFFPVRLKRGYVPLDNPVFPKDPLTGYTLKIPAGDKVVNLPLDEARKLIKSGIAERADGIEI
jgi:hypothetical protein